MNTRNPTSFDYRKQNLDILKTQAQLGANKPGEYDADDWALGELQAIQGKKYKSGWGALIDGMMVGARANMKREKLEKLRGELTEYSNYLEAFKEKNEWFEKKEAEKESMIPFADAGIRLAYQGGSYEETMGGLKNVWDQAKLANPNLKGEFVSYIPNSSIINVRDGQTGKIIPFDLGSISPTAYKMEQDNYLKRQGLSIQQQNADAYGRSVNSNVDYHNAMINKANNAPSKLSHEQQAFNTEQHKILGKQAGEALSNLEADEDKAHGLLSSIKNMKAALDGGAITNENALSAGKLWWGEKFGTKAFYETKNFNVAAKNFLPRMKELFGGRITNADLKLSLDYLIANNNWNKDTINKFITIAEQEVNQKLNRLGKLRELAKENGGTLPLDYQHRIYENEQQSSFYPQQSQGMSQGNGGMVRFKNPNTGKIVELPQSKQNEAINLGFILMG